MPVILTNGEHAQKGCSSERDLCPSQQSCKGGALFHASSAILERTENASATGQSHKQLLGKNEQSGLIVLLPNKDLEDYSQRTTEMIKEV